jgi:hypothetical protein
VSREVMVETCGCMRLRTEALWTMAQITSLWRQDDSPAAKANGKAVGRWQPTTQRALSYAIKSVSIRCGSPSALDVEPRRASGGTAAKRDNPPFVRCHAGWQPYAVQAEQSSSAPDRLEPPRRQRSVSM